jgi:hypothetical protein
MLKKPPVGHARALANANRNWTIQCT